MDRPPFQVDERVLCHQENGDTYEGVVRNAKYYETSKQWSFFIHYNGWNSRHDKWVEANRILKQQQQNSIQTQTNNCRKRVMAEEPQSDDNCQNIENDDHRHVRDHRQPQPTHRPRKRVTRSARDQQLTLPFTLKTVLMEELECLTVRQWRHRLPAAVPIRKLLQHFLKKNPNSEAFCQSLVEIFQHALPKCLLYNEQERMQLVALSQQDEPMIHRDRDHQPHPRQPQWVDVYGCEYLLRLAVQLPSHHLPGHTTLFPELLILMQKNKVGLFPTTLVSAQNPHANYERI